MTQVQDRDRSAALPHGVQGAADPNFACAVRAFSQLFPGPRYGGGALSMYLDGKPVVDVWTGWSDRRGEMRWTADTGALVFSATKGMASTVVHRLPDRGPVAGPDRDRHVDVCRADVAERIAPGVRR